MEEEWAHPRAELVEAMCQKAKARAYNGPWKDKDLSWAWYRLHEELLELAEAIRAGGSYEDIKGEAGDCANFLAILLDLYAL